MVYSAGMVNTPTKGTFRHIVFKDGNTWYAVALEFNIVESADDSKLAFFNLLQAVDGYIASMKKIKGAKNMHALNQKANPEYEKLWKSLNSPSKTAIASPYQVSMFGVSSV